ncbi:MAG: hypothetical protein EOP84_24410 [Verrucomicrobiaceae bacterium]|nr:MAG: hypothetical protein EOP84_24410 [Verrucomicrobiaceae bacterium]
MFLARGGELLYLQLCNAVRQDGDIIRQWSQEAGLSLSENERDPNALHAALISAFNSMLDSCPKTVGRLAEFLDTGVDAETAQATDRENNGQSRFTSCGWCPAESWREGTLFAVELLRLSEAALDPVERIELLEIGCALQVLRSLCAQSARSARIGEASNSRLGYIWAISDPSGEQQVIKQISRRNVNAIQRLIHDALRNPEIAEQFKNLPQSEVEDAYKVADSRYGHKLFLGLAKRIGLITPKRGAGARFVFTDKLLRFLILALVRPGKRVTYETFKALMRAHYGIAVDDEALGAACEWSGTNRLSTLGGSADAWLVDMLAASGVLIRLSDSCSMVENPFARREVTL